jgi:DNA-binding CsgD family transcriptional regulator
VTHHSADAVLLDLVGEVTGLLELDELRTGLLHALLRAVPARWASLNEVGPDRVVAVVEPHLDEEWFARFGELAEQNPIYQHFLRTRDGRANRFSDVTTREQLESTRLFREVYGPLGINHQLAFTLPNEPTHVLAIVLHRERRDFSDGERDLVNRARPFLIQAYRNALAYSDALRAPSAGLEAALAAAGLTARQAGVVRLIALGASNGNVASRLALSERTVQKHLERAYRTLGVSTRSEAAARAWELTASSDGSGETGRPPGPPP